MLTTARRVETPLLGAFVLGLGFSITLAEIVLGLLALCWLARLGEPGRWRSLRFPLLVPCVALAGVSVAAALGSARPAASIFVSKNLLLLATIYLVLHALDGPAQAFRFLSFLSVTLAAVSALAVVQVIVCPSDPGWLPLASRFFRRCDRAHAFYSIYMTLAGVLSVGLLTLVPRLLPGSPDRRKWVVLTCGVEALAVALTYVRGAWVGIVAGVVALAFMARRARFILLGMLLGAVVVILAVTPGLRHRAASIFDPADPTVRERWLIWQSGVLIARDHPIMGVGPGRVSDVYPHYADPTALRARRGHLHNTPLQLLVERGPLGLLAWAWLFAAFFLMGRRALGQLTAPHQARERALVMGSLAATIGFLVAGLFEYNFGDSEVVMVEYCVMAVAIAAMPREAAASP
ncbi:MAG TPA: O-antigen ligase family protein [Candidatus Methylomirabilis sp.]|nr:O-antigen ligase family protein [Candidatus Methylomirabilis sp.]